MSLVHLASMMQYKACCMQLAMLQKGYGAPAQPLESVNRCLRQRLLAGHAAGGGGRVSVVTPISLSGYSVGGRGLVDCQQRVTLPKPVPSACTLPEQP